MITNALCELIFYDGRSERFRAGAASLGRVALAPGGSQSLDLYLTANDLTTYWSYIPGRSLRYRYKYSLSNDSKSRYVSFLRHLSVPSILPESFTYARTTILDFWISNPSSPKYLKRAVRANNCAKGLPLTFRTQSSNQHCLGPTGLQSAKSQLESALDNLRNVTDLNHLYISRPARRSFRPKTGSRSCVAVHLRAPSGSCSLSWRGSLLPIGWPRRAS